ncbi:putative sugar lactone lactonase YvrE [Cylas formicarius]|uniref:putative sugar lactone lactonase YvrE n=1 Tax=Cylas formicarius TaxID=197179 RepID=UPI002958760A|nr:putative sugar lactone lactonase YvrE [Cylas formicarius]
MKMALFTLIFVALAAFHVEGILHQSISEITPPVTVVESLFVDDEEGVIYYVDVISSKVYKHSYHTGKTTSTKIPTESVGAAIPIHGAKHHFLVAADHHLGILKWDGENDSGNITKLKTDLKLHKHEKLFHGKADPEGRLWIGTIRVEDKNGGHIVERGGSLYSITVHKDHSVKVEKKLNHVTIVTGLGWTHDNKSLYFVDSPTRKILKYHFDPEKGSLGKSEVFFDLDHHSKYRGLPHGITLKYNDNVILALWEGSTLLHIDARNHTVIERVHLPVSHPTSLAWGKGVVPNTIYIGTGRLTLTEEELNHNPFNSGSVFTLDKMACVGLPSLKIQLAD